MQLDYGLKINPDFTLNNGENNENAVLVYNNITVIDFCNLSLQKSSLL